MPRNGSGVYSLPPGSTFTPNTIIQSSVVNGINNDIVTDLNTPRPIVAGGTGATTVAGAQAALGLSTGTFGFIFGLTLSNNAGDTTNKIDIAVGTAATDDPLSPVLMTLSSILTKALNVNWAVGSGNGGLDTGTVTNGTYHMFLIQRSDTGVVDALFSNSAISPSMPANYDRKRRIGSFRRIGGTIKAFHQYGDVFYYDNIIIDRNSTSTTSSTLLALSIPSGIVIAPIFSYSLGIAANSCGTMGYGSAAVGSTQKAFSLASTNTSGMSIQVDIPPVYFTNTNGQIYFSLSADFGTLTSSTVYTMGWIDTRGRV